MTLIEIAPPEREKRQRQRIVQTEEGKKQDVAKLDSFLGKQNQEVDRQTISKRKSAPLGEQPMQAKVPSPPSESPSQAKSKGSNQPLSKNDSGFTQNKSGLSRLAVPLWRDNNQSSPQTPDWATPGYRPQDYVPGVAEADRTALNTREYIFYGYFQRIREQLDRAWVPLLREKLLTYHRVGRQLASDHDHTTRLMVTLNENGQVVRLQLVGASGVKDLDDAAIAAFNQAGPFPNPPRGIIDINHEVHIPWDFVLKT